MFAYSQPPLREFRRTSFTGGWARIDEVLFTIPEQLATRAMIELVLLFRTLDDHEDLDDGSRFSIRNSVPQERNNKTSLNP